MNLLKRVGLLALLVCLFSVVSVSLAQAATIDECRYDCPPPPPGPEYDPVVQYDMPEPPPYKIETSQMSSMNSPPDGGIGFDRPMPPQKLSGWEHFWKDFTDVFPVIIAFVVVFALVALIVKVLNDLDNYFSRVAYLERMDKEAMPVQFTGTWEEIEKAVEMVSGGSYNEALYYARKSRGDLIGDNKFNVKLYVPKDAKKTLSSLMRVVKS